MADQGLLVHIGEQGMQVAAAVGRHLHVEGAGEAERPEFLAPGEPHLVFAIAAGHADGQLVLTLAVERPFMLADDLFDRSEEHTSELQSLMRISYAVFCLKKKK